MSKKRILVVEDEAEMVEAIRIRLEQANYEVLVAGDGVEALEKARKEKPDLIILDIMIPKVDGYAVCSLLKRDVKSNTIPIIMLTAKAQESDRMVGLIAGADAYIAKPYHHEILLAKIKELLGD